VTLQIALGFAVHRYDWEAGPRVAAIDFATPRVCGIVANTADRAKGKYPVPLMVESLHAILENSRGRAGDQVLREAVAAMHAALLPLGGRPQPGDGDCWDLGGSATLVTGSASNLLFAHIGEFRTTRVLVSKLERVLDENTLRAQIEREGKIGPGDEFPAGSVITACLGSGQPLAADFMTSVPVSGAERFIIACPSLYECVTERQIADRAAATDPEAAARAILDAALAAGSPLFKPAVCVVDASLSTSRCPNEP
jgi:serine/threonine protein phosphatase PrpC